MRNITWGVLLVAVGVLLLLDNLDVADFSDIIADYWPVLIIIWGASILIRRSSSNRVDTTDPGTATTAGAVAPPAASVHAAVPPPAEPSPYRGPYITSDVVHESTVFGDIEVCVASQNFKGGSLSSVFGDCRLDLSRVGIAEGEYLLRLHNVFGDAHVIVPPDAAIAVSANGIFSDLMVLGQRRSGITSDIRTQTPGYELAARRLRFSASNVFGDLRISTTEF